MSLHSTKEPQPLNRELSSSYLSLTIPTLPLNCQTNAQPPRSCPLSTQISSPLPWGSQSIQHHRTYKAEWRWPLGGTAAAQVSNAEVPCSCVGVLGARGQSRTKFSLDLKLASCQSWILRPPASGSLFLKQKVDDHFL